MSGGLQLPMISAIIEGLPAHIPADLTIIDPSSACDGPNGASLPFRLSSGT